ncbi:beta-glucuronidase [Candidatus Aerophobetes bacterium]|uniref:Beta-glucuronidase n=1 Tax=Aerophobetes bacterium TaxID=2030807 RepID=A0A497E4P1_UNCAE|nr:MAG: beta-glucuronidase [Candidatus Aerophobetes bacterium]
MLYPKANEFRQVMDLSGFFDFKLDPEKRGEKENWQKGTEGCRVISVPASWNEQFLDTKNYLGFAWYFKRFYPPLSWKEGRVWLRIGAANYYAKVWVNGEFVGEHEGGYLPFQFEISDKIRFGEENLLSIEVENELSPTRVPPGNIPPEEEPRPLRFYPDVNFDFFPYGGIHRPVYLFSTPKSYIEDITVMTSIEGGKGIVECVVVKRGEDVQEGRVHLEGKGTKIDQKIKFEGNTAKTKLTVEKAILWSPENPYLYELSVEISSSKGTVDKYCLPVGIRTIEVKGKKLYLNGKPIFLKGFGKHEDFPVLGKGLCLPLMVKDYSLMKWIGANSFRTSHYPYSEEMMDLADRQGFLVIDEIPAVGLFFGRGVERRLALCKQYISELIARDKNHPSVIIWSIANEPHSTKPQAKAFFKELYEHAKSLDPSRPVTLVSMLGLKEEALEFLDLICLNRYYGWYTDSGQLDIACQRLEKELEEIFRVHKKPIILSEFGAGSIAGMHADPPEMFSEEYQAELIRRYCELIESKPYMVGEHVWCFADFKTAQAPHRVILNRKGVFTRTREPKLAAHILRKIWRKKENG